MIGRMREESGVIAVVVAIFSVVMFGLAALVVDLGMAREAKRKAQTAADAAALAGAGELYSQGGALQVGAAVDAVKEAVDANTDDQTPVSSGDWSRCSTTLGAGWTTTVDGVSSGTSCIAFYVPPDSVDATPERVQVVVPAEPVGVLLGGIVGYDGQNVGAVAEASLVSSTVPPCALCVLGPLRNVGADVSVTGGGSLAARDGDLTGGSGRLTVAAPGVIEFTAGAAPASGSQFSPDPPDVNTTRPVVDYYAGKGALPAPLPPVAPTDAVDCAKGSSPTTLAPGRYHDISIGNGTCTLQNGTYVITGRLSLSSAKARVAGAAVTLYFACGTRAAPNECGGGQAGGWLDGGKNGDIQITGSAYNGLSIVYAPANTSPMVVGEKDKNEVEENILGGGVYARSSRVELGRNTTTVNGRMVVGSLVVQGGSTRLQVNAPGLAPVPGPPEVQLTK